MLTVVIASISMGIAIVQISLFILGKKILKTLEEIDKGQKSIQSVLTTIQEELLEIYYMTNEIDGYNYVVVNNLRDKINQMHKVLCCEENDEANDEKTENRPTKIDEVIEERKINELNNLWNKSNEQ